jgi:hypothetical protein
MIEAVKGTRMLGSNSTKYGTVNTKEVLPFKNRSCEESDATKILTYSLGH